MANQTKTFLFGFADSMSAGAIIAFFNDFHCLCGDIIT